VASIWDLLFNVSCLKCLARYLFTTKLLRTTPSSIQTEVSGMGGRRANKDSKDCSLGSKEIASSGEE